MDERVDDEHHIPFRKVKLGTVAQIRQESIRISPYELADKHKLPLVAVNRILRQERWWREDE